MEEIKTEEGFKQEKKFNVLEFYKRYAFWFNCVILSGLFLGNCFLPWLTFIAHAFVLILVIICEIKTAISYLFFVFVFNSLYLPYSALCLAVCVFVMMIRLVVMKAKESKENFYISKTTIVLFIAFFVFLLLPIKREFDIAYLERSLYLLLGAVLIYIFARFPEEFRLRYNLRLMLLGILISWPMQFLYDVSPHLQWVLDDWGGPGKGKGFGALLFNPNTLAMFCLAGLTIYSYYILKYKCVPLDVVVFGMYFIIGVLTMSRAFIIISLFNLLVVLIAGIKNKSKTIGFSFIALIVGLGIIVLVFPDMIKKLINDFSVSSKNNTLLDKLNDFTSSRVKIWSVYWKDWISNPLFIIFGKGISSPVLIKSVKPLHTVNISPHNMYFTMLYQLGIIGTILFITLVVFVIKDALKGKTKVGKAAIVPLISFLLLALVEDMMFYMF